MKYLLIATITLSTNVFAIDFQKATGTFEVKDQEASAVGKDTLAQANFGSFDMNVERSRMPARVTETTKKDVSSVNEITGTFE